MAVENRDTAGAPSGAPASRPLTGEEYLESLRDGREIWLYGERVADVTTHPAFRNTARMIARLYDALHDPKLKDVLTTETDTGSGGYTHRYFRVPKSWEDQLAARDAIAAWARLTYGWLGRAPDYRQRRVLQAVRRQRPRLVQEGPGAGPLPQSRHYPPAG
jgi:4-hydroxyphenylacetate 3-monooxygenase